MTKVFRKWKVLAILLIAIIVMISFVGCGNQGDPGIQGDPGEQGVQGAPGSDGEAGKTPYIGANGNWWIGDTDTGVNAGSVPDPLVALNESKVPLTKEVSGYRYQNGKFYPDYENLTEVQKVSSELNKQIGAEGFVLLKNDDNALPLSGKNVTMFGHRSYDPMTGGGGSGAGRPGQYGVPYTDLVQGMKLGGFYVNPGVENIYKGLGTTSTERDVSILPTSYGFKDAAIITIGRSGSEGSDIKRSAAAGHTDTTEHFLQLEDNEVSLIKYVKQHFNKVIVLINSANTLELGELNAPKTADNLGVDAILQVGHIGNDSAAALGDILNGNISPSGKTVDIWVKDFTKDPTYKNFSDMTHLGAGWNNSLYNSDGTESTAHRTVQYREDIYVGYKYYETAYDDMQAAGLDGDSWYEEQILYPFGYGLSYTDFKWELVGAGEGALTAANETVTLQVKVTNTGKVPGKDVVQMYVNPPYKLGGIEKASTNLMAFAKTKLLSPGESQVVTLQCVAQDFASFDWNDANVNTHLGYELEAGNYIVSVNRNSHEEVLSVTRTVSADIKCTTDVTTGNEITAVLSQKVGTWAAFNSTTDSLTNNLLSRVDLTAVPESASIADRTMSKAFEAEITALEDAASCKDKTTDPWYVSNVPAGWDQNVGTRDATTGRVATLLRDMSGVPYQEYEIKNGNVIVGTDEGSQKWEAFLNQLTWTEMLDAVQCGWYARPAIDSIGKSFEADVDGPQQMGAPLIWIPARAPGVVEVGTCWAGAVIQASTWNVELLEEIGKAIGNEALFQNANGWYGPGMNLHRSPFGGRNFEYYSEDGILSGKIAASVVRGASSKGLTTFIKHMFLNEQEASRDKIFSFATEQAIREIYIKPFETAVKEGHAMGIMASKNRIGKVSAEANSAVSNAMFRGEWNFRGTIITDAYSGEACKTVDAMVRTGTDTPLGGKGMRTSNVGMNAKFIEANRWDAATKMVYAGTTRIAWNAAAADRTDDKLTLASPTLYASVRRSAMHLLYTAANTSGNRNGFIQDETIELNYNIESGKTSVSSNANVTNKFTLSDVTIKSGALPAGVTISKFGILSGNITVAGTYTATIECVVDGWVGVTSTANSSATNNQYYKAAHVREKSRIIVEITVTKAA